jgi:hypothetical protein
MLLRVPPRGQDLLGRPGGGPRIAQLGPEEGRSALLVNLRLPVPSVTENLGWDGTPDAEDPSVPNPARPSVRPPAPRTRVPAHGRTRDEGSRTPARGSPARSGAVGLLRPDGPGPAPPRRRGRRYRRGKSAPRRGRSRDGWSRTSRPGSNPRSARATGARLLAAAAAGSKEELRATLTALVEAEREEGNLVATRQTEERLAALGS